MKLIKSNPRSAGSRHQINVNKSVLSKSASIIKKLVFNVHKSVGRSSSTGHITVRSRGAGVKTKYRNLNTQANNGLGIIVCSLYTPNTTSFTSLNFDLLRYTFSLLPAVATVYAGSVVSCGKFIELKLGYRSCLNYLPVGILLNNISISNQKSSIYGRSAGVVCVLLQKTKISCLLRLPSSEIVSVSNLGFGTVGILSNGLHRFVVVGKAGRTRLAGFRPKVRGIAMNPIDHPHGGRTNGGVPSLSPWSKPTKGKPTVFRKRIYSL